MPSWEECRERTYELMKRARPRWIEMGFNVFTRDDGILEINVLDDLEAWEESEGVKACCLGFPANDDEAVEMALAWAWARDPGRTYSHAAMFALWLDGKSEDRLWTPSWLARRLGDGA